MRCLIRIMDHPDVYVEHESFQYISETARDMLNIICNKDMPRAFCLIMDENATYIIARDEVRHIE